MSDARIRRTWEERELPLLEAIARAEAEYTGRRPFNSLDPWLRDASGLGESELERGLRALYEAGYVAGNAKTFGGVFHLLDIHLLERGLRLVGQWPSEDQFDAFVAILEQRISEAPDEAERTRLEQVRDAALGVGRDVLTSVLSTWARGQIGL